MTWSHVTARVLATAAMLLPASMGCAGRFRPPPGHDMPPPAAEVAEIWTLPSPRLGHRIFERKNLMRNETDQYAQIVEPDRVIEGACIGRPFLAIREYLRRPEMTPREMESLPKAPLKAHYALMFELDSPRRLYPQQLRRGEPALATSRVGCFDQNGHRFCYGRVTRTAVTEGIEDVSCPAGEFKDCRRLRVELEFRFPWGPVVDVTRYMWLAEGVGEVRRIEHVRGVVWLLFLESAYEYLLVSFTPTEPYVTSSPTSKPAEALGVWSCIAVLFDRTFPQPRVGGVLVELTEAEGADEPIASDADAAVAAPGP
ncbi:MAG: hypothetical protein JXA69_01315 [Phycisphaerae bacterium]|nr:hypothetical protein [Phycisphaerae bacterium]